MAKSVTKSNVCLELYHGPDSSDELENTSTVHKLMLNSYAIRRPSPIALLQYAHLNQISEFPMDVTVLPHVRH